MYCLEDDCGGFTYDEESTIMALCQPDPMEATNPGPESERETK
jgi:hypothetical protein